MFNFISIIIPTLNEEECILNNLQSFNGFRKNFEVIVVDGGSTDNTQGVVQDFRKNAKYPFSFLSSNAVGRGSQMNEGVKLAQGNILLFLHADTLLTDNALYELTEAIQDEKIIGGAFPIQFSNKKKKFRLMAFYSNARAKYTKVFYGDQAIFLRKSVFWEIGGYPELPIMEDVALSKKMKKKGIIQFLESKVITSSRRIEANGVLKSFLYFTILRILYFLRIRPERLAKIYNTKLLNK